MLIAALFTITKNLNAMKAFFNQGMGEQTLVLSNNGIFIPFR